MNAELQNTLYEKYPYFFSNKDKGARLSCMAFGIDFGDGWHDILNNLCYEINQYENHVLNEKSSIYNKDYERVKFDQLKEKFGRLRAYVSGGDDYTRGLVNMAEAISGCVCETCGNKGKPNKTGWIVTLCEKCRGVSSGNV
jgi:hypothetical protein